MKIWIFFIIITGLNFDCIAQSKDSEKINAQVAVQFMNDYMNYCNSRENKPESWIAKNQLLSKRFKDEYKRILDEALKDEPEIGLGFDPIFNAQDYPDKGFKINHIEEKSGYVTLNGIDWVQFTVTVKVIKQNDKWIVDGAGIINIPEDKQRK